MVGQRLLHYEILEKIGAGGMGVVYRARDTHLEREVALKILPPGSETDEDARSRLLREARTASALNHPHICTIYEVGEAGGHSYLAMELVRGRPLSASIPAHGLPADTILDFGIQMADALAHAHERGIVHRDLKSSNVMVTPEHQVKLLDFGLARRLEEKAIAEATRSQKTLSDAGDIAGTLPYMAPEVLRGDPAEARSDLWALGVVLYELAAGELPFHAHSGFELSTRILREPPPPLPEPVPPGLRAVILRCLAKQPGQRYQHASEVRAALEALRSDSAIRAAIGASRMPARKRVWLLAAGGILAVAVLLAGFFLGTRKNTSPSSLAGGGHLNLLVSSANPLGAPALSPDGKMIAYVAEEQGRFDLYVSRTAGGERVRLTSDDTREDSPAFSPDGERIAFTRTRADTLQTELCLIPSLGGEVVPLASGADDPAWSPDGSRLAVVLRRPGTPEELATLAADGTDQRSLLRADAQYPFLLHPAWSPDGAHIAFVRSTGGIGRQLWMIRASGGEPVQLSHDPPGVFSHTPVFTPDGRALIHQSNRGGATNLWLLPLDGKPPVRLTSGPGPDEMPSVARDGKIAFLSSRSRASLVLLDLAAKHTRVLFTHPATLWAPAFSKDGREIAFSRLEMDGSWHIWTIPVEGGQPRQITFGKLPEIYPRYGQDSGFVFFFTWGSEPNRIWRVPRAGGPPTTLTPPRDQDDAYADPSPDGRHFVFARTEAGVVRATLGQIDSPEVKPLSDSPSTVPRWSPDGKWIAFSPDRSYTAGIFLVREDGTGLRKLTQIGGWPVWWPDSKQLAYQVVGPDGNEQIQVTSLSGGTTRVIEGIEFDGTNYPFDISPDGRWLVSTNGTRLSDEIWLLGPASVKK